MQFPRLLTILTLLAGLTALLPAGRASAAPPLAEPVVETAWTGDLDPSGTFEVTFTVVSNDFATSYPFATNFRLYYNTDSVVLDNAAVSGGAVESIPTIDGGFGGSMIVGPETPDTDNGGLPNVYRNILNDGTGYNTTNPTPGLFKVTFTMAASPTYPFTIGFGPNPLGSGSLQWINDADGPGGNAAILGNFANWTPDFSATTGLANNASVAEWVLLDN
jgi:hypothetical protein